MTLTFTWIAWPDGRRDHYRRDNIRFVRRFPNGRVYNDNRWLVSTYARAARLELRPRFAR